MRTGVGSVLALGLALLAVSEAGATEIQTPPKWIKIVNDSKITLFPILYIGATDGDDWMRGKFQTSKDDIKADTYARKKIYRTYIGDYITQGGKQIYNGLPAGATVYVQIPFYSKLVMNPKPTLNDQYIDWWNGGRVFFYDVPAQVAADYKTDSANKVAVFGDRVVSCGTLNASRTECVAPKTLPVFSAASGYPPSDLSQLIEYTFADTITANGPPYPLVAKKVGYNISSVDQTYLPVAMQPFANPLVPYIGTTIGVSAFRERIKKFLADFPGWPVYTSGNGGFVDHARPRVPGTYNVFASQTDLTPPGKAVAQMRALYGRCILKNTDNTAFCKDYKEVYNLFRKNWIAYNKLACSKRVKLDFNKLIIGKIYGWVPFNENCGAGVNSLLSTAGNAADLAELQATYEGLQYNKAEIFNPYVQLIHSPKYLDQAAYAFSVDDAIGFQSYEGKGLILDFGGSNGLENKNKLDLRDKVTVTLGVASKNQPKWRNYGLCSDTANTGSIDNAFPVFDLYPQKYPCRITLTDVIGRSYSFDIETGPRPSGLSLHCTRGTPGWCQGVYVPMELPKRQGISTPPPGTTTAPLP